jgi:hypothetical protein
MSKKQLRKSNYRRYKMRNFQPFLIMMIALILVSLACGSIEVGIVTPTIEEHSNNAIEIQEPTVEASISSPEDSFQPSEQPTNIPVTAMPQLETKPGVPVEVTLGPLGYGHSGVGLVVIEDQTVRIADSPVEFGLLWDYSPTSGRLAYASEFFRGSEPSGNVVPGYSISDLWIYDYVSGESERWLSDYVNHAVWAPGGERITASIFNPESNQLDLVLVSGLDQYELVATCVSSYFSWSPNSDMLTYAVSSSMTTGMPVECFGIFLVSGMQSGEYQIERVLSQGVEQYTDNFPGFQPFWTLEQDALISPTPPFGVVPLDGSQPFIPQFLDGFDSDLFFMPGLSLWNMEQRQMIVHAFGGLSNMGGVWVFQFSSDFRTVENYYRLGDPANTGNSDINLISWWEYGESVLVADGDIPEPKPIINEFWFPPKVWSFVDQTWTELAYQQ